MAFHLCSQASAWKNELFQMDKSASQELQCCATTNVSIAGRWHFMLLSVRADPLRGGHDRERAEEVHVNRAAHSSLRRGMQANYRGIRAIHSKAEKPPTQRLGLFTFHGLLRHAWSHWSLAERLGFSSTKRSRLVCLFPAHGKMNVFWRPSTAKVPHKLRQARRIINRFALFFSHYSSLWALGHFSKRRQDVK